MRHAAGDTGARLATMRTEGRGRSGRDDLVRAEEDVLRIFSCGTCVACVASCSLLLPYRWRRDLLSLLGEPLRRGPFACYGRGGGCIRLHRLHRRLHDDQPPPGTHAVTRDALDLYAYAFVGQIPHSLDQLGEKVAQLSLL